MVLRTISSKGLKLWPRDDSFFMNSDHWCCRFMPDSGEITHQDITNLLSKLASAKIDFIKVENLYNFDGKPGYSLAQGE
jgi:isocitrate dehydrogenase